MLAQALPKHKLFALLLAGILIFFPSLRSQALEAGEITLHSSLGEPLAASIELSELEATLDAITVSLGSEADYQRLGLEPLPGSRQLNFELEALAGGRARVNISSVEAWNEPFLDLLVNLQWPGGRLLREYTLLLDLPVFSDAPAPATPSPPVASPAPAVAAPASSMPGEAPPSVVIQSGDTLWEIALNTRPDNTVSVQQMMIAIQQLNMDGDAFIGNNINRIRTGRILRIPSRAEILAISEQQALQQVAAQNQQTLATQPLAAAGPAPAAAAAAGGDELSIIAGSGQGSAAGADTGLAETIARLENELALSEEERDRARLENAELVSRLNELEQQIGILENIIAIEDQRIAELQAQLAAQAAAAAQAMQAAETAAVQAQQAAQDNTMLGRLSQLLQNSFVLIAALVLFLFLVVAVLLWRNRRLAHSKEDELLAEFGSLADSSDGGLAGARQGAVAAAGLAGGAGAYSAAATHEDAGQGWLENLKQRFFAWRGRDNDDDEEFTLPADRVNTRKDPVFPADESAADDDVDEDYDFSDADADADADDADDYDDYENDEPELDEQEDHDSSEDDEAEDDDDDEDDDPDFDELEDYDDESELELTAYGNENSGADAQDDKDTDEAEAADEFFTEEENEEDAEDAEDEEDADDRVLAGLTESSLSESAGTAATSAETDETISFSEQDDKRIDFEAGLNLQAAEPDAGTASQDQPAAGGSTAGTGISLVDFNLEPVAVPEISGQAAETESSLASDVDELDKFDFKLDIDDKLDISSNFETADDDTVFEIESIDFTPAGSEAAVTGDPAADLDITSGSADENPATSESREEKAGIGLGNLGFDQSVYTDEDDDAELEMITDQDEASTKLDLAVAYEAMNDVEGAREILQEVIAEGNEEQIAEARKLLDEWRTR